MTISLPDIGEISVKSSRRARRIILKITSEGAPQVTLPYGTPKFVAKRFATQNKDWILKHMNQLQSHLLTDGAHIGKTHTLRFIHGDTVKSRVTNSEIRVAVPSDAQISSQGIQVEARKASTRAIRRQAEEYLPKRLYQMAELYGYKFKEVRCKALKTRWGSCSSDRIINLNIWLMQLPNELIDYVLVHELVHLNHPNHQKDFWAEVESIMPSHKKLRKELKQYNPALNVLA